MILLNMFSKGDVKATVLLMYCEWRVKEENTFFSLLSSLLFYFAVPSYSLLFLSLLCSSLFFFLFFSPLLFTFSSPVLSSFSLLLSSVLGSTSLFLSYSLHISSLFFSLLFLSSLLFFLGHSRSRNGGGWCVGVIAVA